MFQESQFESSSCVKCGDDAYLTVSDDSHDVEDASGSRWANLFHTILSVQLVEVDFQRLCVEYFFDLSG